jgi:hypothetical protein
VLCSFSAGAFGFVNQLKEKAERLNSSSVSGSERNRRSLLARSLAGGVGGTAVAFTSYAIIITQTRRALAASLAAIAIV